MSTSPNQRQTVSYLTRRFKQVGIRPDTKHGQNFLIDMNLQSLLANRAELGPQDVVLEVGTGTGALTALIAPQAASVVTVEVDPRMFQLASEELIDFDNISMLQQDVLRNKNNYHSHVIDVLKQRLAEGPAESQPKQLRLIANLPYNIATPVITNLLLTEIVPVSMTVTIQKELADRMLAEPRTKDYSALSIWMQCQCRIELVRVMPPSVFWPAPKVDSAILHIEVDQTLRDRIPDLNYFHRFVRAMFFHRRKFLRSVVLSAFKKRLSKPQVDEVMARLELGPTSRAEELGVEMMLRLCEALRTIAGDPPPG